MSYKLLKPYNVKQRRDFIKQYERNMGLAIEETSLALYALEPNEIMVGEFPQVDPDWEEKQAQKEKERVARLTCTKRDFALMLQELGVDYFTELKPLIESNPQAQLEWELCERLYRFNPMLDLMAAQLGVTPEQLDGLFKYANGEIKLDDFKALKDQTEDNLDMVDNEDITAVEGST